MITITNLNLQRGQKRLFDQASVLIKSQQKVGVIGKNGCGKSSLFKLLLGTLEADSGELLLPQHFTIAHVAQEMPNSSEAALDFVLAGDEQLQQLRDQLIHTEDGEQVALLHARLQEIDAYSAEARAGSLLHGLGFSTAEQQKPVDSFSGGWRVRLNLARALMCRSDLLLLDEPTNHLDLDAVIWLENFLNQYQGTLLLISHDREFLDNVINHILHVEQQGFKFYTGDYSQFEQQRGEHLALQQKQHEKQQKQITHLQDFVDKFRYKASKAKQAQSRIKAIERMEKIAAAHVDSEFSFAFKPLKHLPDPLVTLEHADAGYADKKIVSEVDFQIRPDSRMALLGPNGAGKSTVLKSLLGELPLLAGELHQAANLRIGYFAQYQMDLLREDESALQHFQQMDRQAGEKVARQYLGSFAFSGDQALMPIRDFSGGEKARLVLALIIWQSPNLLLLDEPTNHFDIDMREALTLALQDYQGGLLLISHDRHLMRTCCDELWLTADGQCQRFDGDVDDYASWLLNRNKAASSSKPVNKRNKKQQRQQRAKRQQEIKAQEKQMLALEKQLAVITEQLAEPEIYQDKARLKPLLAEQRELQSQLQKIELVWLAAQEEDPE